MLILFWVVVGLTVVLISRNARYAFHQYLADRNRLILSLYFIFLLALGYMVIHITSRIMNLVEAANETDIQTISPVRRHLRPPSAAQMVDN